MEIFTSEEPNMGSIIFMVQAAKALLTVKLVVMHIVMLADCQLGCCSCTRADMMCVETKEPFPQPHGAQA